MTSLHDITKPCLSPQPVPGVPESIRIVAWDDPAVERAGHDPRSWYSEHFWLPVLGPTSTWFLRRVAAGLDESSAGFTLDVREIARALGLGGRLGKNSPFTKAVDRCVTFGFAARPDEGTLAVRRVLPSLARRHLLRLPPRLQRMHEAWVHAEKQIPVFERQRCRARRLALGLIAIDDGLAQCPDSGAVDVQLLRWGVHPALVDDAIAWARRADQSAQSDQGPRATGRPGDRATGRPSDRATEPSRNPAVSILKHAVHMPPLP